MNESDSITAAETGIAKLPVVAAVLALIGLVDAAYLTVHHYTAEPVPCSIVEGCETVLTSAYAQIGGFPIAGLGAIAYFVAFSLAVLAAYGSRPAWLLFGAQATLIAVVSGFLVYLQASVIGAFCQFCLISAATSFSLFVIFLISKFLVGRT